MIDVIYCKDSVFQMHICSVIISPYTAVLKYSTVNHSDHRWKISLNLEHLFLVFWVCPFSFCSLWMWPGSRRIFCETGRLHLYFGLPETLWHTLLQLWWIHWGRSGVSTGQNLSPRLLCVCCLQVGFLHEVVFLMPECPECQAFKPIA